MTRLYVVDDDRGFLDIVRDVAMPMGFDTVTASTPEAFKSLYGFEPDAVIMIDMIMPETDGIELLSWLSGRGPAGAVILVSGFGEHYTLSASALATAKGLAVTDRLSKPIRLARLREALEAAREIASARR